MNLYVHGSRDCTNEKSLGISESVMPYSVTNRLHISSILSIAFILNSSCSDTSRYYSTVNLFLRLFWGVVLLRPRIISWWLTYYWPGNHSLDTWMSHILLEDYRPSVKMSPISPLKTSHIPNPFARRLVPIVLRATDEVHCIFSRAQILQFILKIIYLNLEIPYLRS